MQIQFDDIEGAYYVEIFAEPEELLQLLNKEKKLIGATAVFDGIRYYMGVYLKKGKEDEEEEK